MNVTTAGTWLSRALATKVWVLFMSTLPLHFFCVNSLQEACQTVSSGCEQVSIWRHCYPIFAGWAGHGDLASSLYGHLMGRVSQGFWSRAKVQGNQ